MEKDVLKDILCQDDVCGGIKNSLDKLLAIAPELRDMIGFEHMHPHHHLDVWEHTLCALSFAPNDFDVRLAVLLHDVGKPHSFQFDGTVRHFKGHPEMSAKIAREILTRVGFAPDYVEFICTIVARHDTPLTENDFETNPQLANIIFKVQQCDIFAHNPAHNQKRLEYINAVAQFADK